MFSLFLLNKLSRYDILFSRIVVLFSTVEEGCGVTTTSTSCVLGAVTGCLKTCKFTAITVAVCGYTSARQFNPQKAGCWDQFVPVVFPNNKTLSLTNFYISINATQINSLTMLDFSLKLILSSHILPLHIRWC